MGWVEWQGNMREVSREICFQKEPAISVPFMMVNEEPTSLELMHDPKSIYGANMSWLNVVVSHDVGINVGSEINI